MGLPVGDKRVILIDVEVFCVKLRQKLIKYRNTNHLFLDLTSYIRFMSVLVNKIVTLPLI